MRKNIEQQVKEKLKGFVCSDPEILEDLPVLATSEGVIRFISDEAYTNLINKSIYAQEMGIDFDLENLDEVILHLLKEYSLEGVLEGELEPKKVKNVKYQKNDTIHILKMFNQRFEHNLNELARYNSYVDDPLNNATLTVVCNGNVIELYTLFYHPLSDESVYNYVSTEFEILLTFDKKIKLSKFNLINLILNDGFE